MRWTRTRSKQFRRPRRPTRPQTRSSPTPMRARHSHRDEVIKLNEINNQQLEMISSSHPGSRGCFRRATNALSVFQYQALQNHSEKLAGLSAWDLGCDSRSTRALRPRETHRAPRPQELHRSHHRRQACRRRITSARAQALSWASKCATMTRGWASPRSSSTR